MSYISKEDIDTKKKKTRIAKYCSKQNKRMTYNLPIVKETNNSFYRKLLKKERAISQRRTVTQKTQ